MPPSSRSQIQQTTQSRVQIVSLLRKRGHELTGKGTRQFCLDYHLPICRGATNDPTHGDDTVKIDISTVCFRIPPFPLLVAEFPHIWRLTIGGRARFTEGPTYCYFVFDCDDGVAGLCSDTALCTDLVSGACPFILLPGRNN